MFFWTATNTKGYTLPDIQKEATSDLRPLKFDPSPSIPLSGSWNPCSMLLQDPPNNLQPNCFFNLWPDTNPQTILCHKTLPRVQGHTIRKHFPMTLSTVNEITCSHISLVFRAVSSISIHSLYTITYDTFFWWTYSKREDIRPFAVFDPSSGGGQMSPRECSETDSHPYSCSPCLKTPENNFSGKNNFQCFFWPRKWRESHGLHGSALRLIHIHTCVLHAQKPPEPSFQAKIIFDVFLTCHKQTHIRILFIRPSLQSREHRWK